MRVIPSLEAVDPVVDSTLLSQRLVDPLVEECQVHYVNFFVGECKTLVFGVSLTDYAAMNPGLNVPRVVSKCIELVEKHGLAKEGIYRISPASQKLKMLVLKIEQDEETFPWDDLSDEVDTVAGILKVCIPLLWSI